MKRSNYDQTPPSSGRRVNPPTYGQGRSPQPSSRRRVNPPTYGQGRSPQPSYKSTKIKKEPTVHSYKNKQPKRNTKQKIAIGAIFLGIISMSGYGLFSIFNLTSINNDIVDANTLDNKVMAGYQGWFMAAGDGSGRNWRHWASSTPNPSTISFDMWPDLREYDSDELFATDFVYSNGQNAGLYSAYTPKTVDRHVKWMKDYGIDGVFVQRFVCEAVDITSVRDRVLDNIRIASEKYGRVFANMYDISGADENNLVEDIKNDWMHLVDDERITESGRYLRHNGRPVLSIWGFGCNNRPGTPSQAEELFTWLTETAHEKYRVTLKGGLNDNWRTQLDWTDAYRKLDVISPWAVGRYASNSGADNFRNNIIEPDLAECQNLDIDYMPVVFPGFSWYNLKDGSSPLNQIPRNGGRFFWHQVYNAIDAGCNMIYVAMFDEVDEGTAMFKITENTAQTPTTGAFVTLDADGESIPSDWYLRLMGESSKMLRGEISLTPSIPISSTSPVVVVPNYAPGISLGDIEEGEITEASGLSKSRINGNTFYTMEDSGGPAAFYAFTSSGQHLGKYICSGAQNIDWEDMAIGPGPNPANDYLYLGDIGDNGASRSSIKIYRVEEPVINANSQVNSPITTTLSCDKITLLYPDGARDSEAIFIDPITGDFFLLSKREADNNIRLYRVSASQLVDGATVTMNFEHLVKIRRWCTAADISPDGTLITTRSDTTDSGRVFARQSGETVSEALNKIAPYFTIKSEPQGEAITFDTDHNIYTLSEGSHQPLYKYTAQ